MYKIKFTEKFEKKLYKLIPQALQGQTWKRIRGLAKNPYSGKQLRYPFIRELKIEKFRIYFIIFDKEIVVLLVNVSDKKDQQEVIDWICDNKKLLYNYVKNLK